MTKGLIAGVLLVSVAGCGSRPEATAPPKGSTSPERLTLAAIPKGTVHEFWKAVEAGVRKAAAELDVDIRWEGPTNETEHDRQRSIVDNMVGLGVDGIALAPTDETALVRPVRSAMQRGIPVVIYDSNLNAQQGTDFVSFVATDNEKGGRLAGEHLVERLGDGAGRVVVLRYTEGSGSTLRRERGFLDVMQRAKNIKVLDHQFSDGSTAGALSTATNMLSQFISDNTLQIDGIFASNLATTLGMQRALDRLRKQGVQVRVNFIGFDASQKLIEGVEQGEIEALVVQNPRHMGYLAIETLVKHIRGQPVAPYIDTGVELVTKDRLTEPAIRALLGF